MRKIKIGVIGTGTMGNCHADQFAKYPDFQLTALCDIDEAALKRTAEKHSITQTYTDYRKFLANADVEAVVVPLPNYLHAPVSIAALEAGKHVFCEKPMTVSVKDAKAMVAAAVKARKKGLAMQIGVVWRQDGRAMTIKKLIDSGKLGEIYHVRATLIRRRGIPGLGGWFTTAAKSGGGAVMDIGVHWIDLAMYVASLWNATAVSAANYAKFGPLMKGYHFGGMWAGPPRYDGTFDVEDYTTGLVRFGKSATMNFNIAWAVNGPDAGFIEFNGTKGGAVFMPWGDKVTLYTEQKKQVANVELPLASTEEFFARQGRLFAAACRGKGNVPATPEQGLDVVRVLTAINRSAKAGKEVKVQR
ncbi:MAG: Gfo/Idh/MocA family oxidoreductase [Planctomycetaceae bacterium]|nr:Gfo/Idh/MocA family oxidoreductase [Planctomycetaceae bacterium]